MRSIYSVFVLSVVTMFYTLFVVIIGTLMQSRRRGYAYIRLWAKSLVAIFGVRVIVQGDEKIDFNRQVVFMSNHRSQADIPILMVAIPAGLSFISKQILAKIPFLGWSMRAVGMVFIRRSDPKQAIDILKQASDDIPKDMNFIIFPEGTRSNLPKMNFKSIKKGGFHLAKTAGRDIQPVAVSGSEQILKNGTLAIMPGSVEVRFGNPIPVTADSDIEELIEQYKAEMEVLLEDPIREATAIGSKSMLDHKC